MSVDPVFQGILDDFAKANHVASLTVSLADAQFVLAELAHEARAQFTVERDNPALVAFAQRVLELTGSRV